MPQSPRLSEKPSQTPASLSGPMLVFMTALDTTWRAFVPTLGGTFAGIGIDKLFNFAPWGVIVGLILGTILSTVLIVQQLINVRKPLK